MSAERGAPTQAQIALIPAEIIDRMHGLAWEAEGGCWLWSSVGTKPTMCVAGRRYPMRALLAKLMGLKIPKGSHASNVCMDSRCVNPEHIRVRTRSEILAIAYHADPHRPIAVMRAAQTRRSNGKLTPEIVREIRASENSQMTLARKYGISKTHVRRIANGDAWREHGMSIWAGLLRS